MALLHSIWAVNDLEILIWMDPKRYRATIWKKQHPSWLVRRMHDKDVKRLYRRAVEFAEKYEEK